MKFCNVRFLSAFISIMFSVQGQDDFCDGVTCNNKGDCVPRSQYSRGYWCKCDEGWAGQDCLFPEPTVSCADEQITVLIDKGLVRELGIDDDAQYVYFGQSSGAPQCRASNRDNFYQLTISTPFSSCGTQIIQRTAGDDYTFSNTVVWNREVNNPGDIIERELLLLDFKCIYEDTYTTVGPLPPETSTLRLVTERGSFDVRLRLFEDQSYLPAYEYIETPAIPIGTNVYVQIELEHVTNEHLVVTLDRCFASQSPDPADPISTKHTLIVNRCVNENDTTVHVLLNGEALNARFKFQMFKWRWSADDVYLHCEVDICNKSSEMCTGEGSDCKGAGYFRKKREARSKEGMFDPSFIPHIGHIITKGPLRIVFDESKSTNSLYFENENQDSTLLTLGATLGVILFTIAIAIGVYCRRRRNLFREIARIKSEEESMKRLSSFNISTESF